MRTLVKATLKDCEMIRDYLHDNYYKESIYCTNTEYDAAQALKFIESWIDEICYMVMEGDKLAGILSAYITYSYYKRPECQVVCFYVHPDYRGEGASRDMVELLTTIADMNNVCAIYTTSASGIGEVNNTLYTNLFKKHGFQQLGTELVRFNNV